MRKILLILCLTFVASSMQAQEASVFGKWKTIDDNTGEAKSIVEIYQKDGKVYGKIANILNPADRDKTCIYCKGADKGKPLIGLTIIKDLEKDGDKYEDGTIFDPEKGKEYTAKIWVEKDEPNTLMVRGYIAFLYRTQEWIRVDD
ncbi:DUF2147 domain-containing protein [Dokdonia sinensis]|uniref:DUF2147 domain-containing protein n=1 Tax=Dokdonia sinensis TaxID=2479847 RepID=A0A3M0G930_9FLAO|nr:DUF2147 domain-containing protein [Dokdonia sinensis]RMB60928.1 DUF2147 domain-containing protein [Dokdonia sinensis]